MGRINIWIKCISCTKLSVRQTIQTYVRLTGPVSTCVAKEAGPHTKDVNGNTLSTCILVIFIPWLIGICISSGEGTI
jgi:hypothetical protein